jgi:hypothetical protein
MGCWENLKAFGSVNNCGAEGAMVGRVFISCGQRSTEEQSIAIRIRELLKSKFELESWLAFKIQGLYDIMKITDELKASDYYLFIDFRRNSGTDLPCSLFTHQEMALAHHVGFRDIIALQQEGAPLEGFLRYVLSNPEHFKDESELLQKIEELVRERGWNKDFSRNLVLEEVEPQPPMLYGDHSGQHMERIWHARIRNRRPDVAAVNSVCILDYIEYPDGSEVPCPDRSYLKWARQSGYQRTILPEDQGKVDIFALHADGLGIFLHSASDEFPRFPIVSNDGKYKLHYKLYSESFPLLHFCIEVDYHHTSPTAVHWENQTSAGIIGRL